MTYLPKIYVPGRLGARLLAQELREVSKSERERLAVELRAVRRQARTAAKDAAAEPTSAAAEAPVEPGAEPAPKSADQSPDHTLHETGEATANETADSTKPASEIGEDEELASTTPSPDLSSVIAPTPLREIVEALRMRASQATPGDDLKPEERSGTSGEPASPTSDALQRRANLSLVGPEQAAEAPATDGLKDIRECVRKWAVRSRRRLRGKRSQTGVRMRDAAIPTEPAPEAAAEPQSIARPKLRAKIATGIAGLAASALTVNAGINYYTFEALRARAAPVALTGPGGESLGIVPRSDALTTGLASGALKPQVTLASRSRDADFMKALYTLEGQTIVLGVSPHYLLRGLVCSPIAWMGVQENAFLALSRGKCAGASTPLMLVSRTLRGNNEETFWRKWTEVVDAVTLSVMKSDEEIDRIIQDNLHFGQANGNPIHGYRAMALVTFGREPEDLTLEEKAMAASMAKNPLAIACGGQNTASFEQIRSRGKVALGGFAGDPRQAGALGHLAAMRPVVEPAPLPPTLAARLIAAEACPAAAHPLALAQATAGAANIDLARLGTAHPERISEVRLALTPGKQDLFQTNVVAGLGKVRNGNWRVDPLGGQVVTLAFTTTSDGRIDRLFEGGKRDELDKPHRAASLAKFGAMLILARHGMRATDLFCNHEAQGRQNAGGDKGFASCDMRGAMETVTHVFGHSRNLPIYNALRTRLTPQQLREEATALGFDVGADPAADLAFGMATIRPTQVASLMSAISHGIAGRAPTAPGTRLVDRYRTDDGWQRATAAQFDLSPYFAPKDARAFITAAARAPLESGGTLNGILTKDTPLGADEVGKTGTDDYEGRTRAKVAAGASGAGAWFVMVFPLRGELGNGDVSISPLSRTVRTSAFDKPGGIAHGEPKAGQ